MSDAAKFYLFDMTTGKKKLAYGVTPDEALEILATRMTPEEMSLIVKDRYVKVLQRDLQTVVDLLG